MLNLKFMWTLKEPEIVETKKLDCLQNLNSVSILKTVWNGTSIHKQINDTK